MQRSTLVCLLLVALLGFAFAYDQPGYEAPSSMTPPSYVEPSQSSTTYTTTLSDSYVGYGNSPYSFKGFFALMQVQLGLLIAFLSTVICWSLATLVQIVKGIFTYVIVFGRRSLKFVSAMLSILFKYVCANAVPLTLIAVVTAVALFCFSDLRILVASWIEYGRLAFGKLMHQIFHGAADFVGMGEYFARAVAYTTGYTHITYQDSWWAAFYN